MTTITLTNDFHGTKVTLRPTNGQISARQVERAKHALCGVAGCACGDTLGARGPQEVEVLTQPAPRGQRGHIATVHAR